MADVQNRLHDRLIGALAANMQPVRPLRSPLVRALVWLALVAVIAAALAAFANLPAMWHRLSATPDMWFAVIGSASTTAAAALAAFELSMPDRSRAWALLPLPAFALWLGASGLGCLRAYVLPETHVATMGEARDCLVFIVGLSLPLSAALILMLRRAYSLAPALTATMAGLASAAAAATLLNFFHPYDAAATDLTVHLAAVVLVIVALRTAGSRVLRNFSR